VKLKILTSCWRGDRRDGWIQKEGTGDENVGMITMGTELNVTGWLKPPGSLGIEKRMS
jgi:hypothetical protein